MPYHVTLNDLLTRLCEEDDQPIVFRTADRAVQAGYHLTEFKLARVRSVDCGRRAHEWNEAVVELLDGHGRGSDEFMRTSKLSAIAAKVVSTMPEMGDAPLVIEFGTDGLVRYRVETIQSADPSENGGWIVSLAPMRGQCKAALGPTCCAPTGRVAAPAACCEAS